ncbi:MAG: Do family serine endopeptidase [Candidatus Omnitrophica bacterium]|nr:Do family serine endopeptidase [Candidatus Omnitrophota bacterium]
MKRRRVFLGLFFLGGLAAGVILTARLDLFPKAESQSVKPVSAAVAEIAGFEGAVIKVADTAGKAVVSISTEHVTKIKSPGRRYYFGPGGPFGNEPQFGDDPFRKFFDEFFGDIPDREFRQQGLGSGVIIDPQGYILTNEHVISGADKITVTLPDGREFKGEIKGKDMRSDLAIIKINSTSLPTAPLGDSDSLRIGEWAVAIGNPYGFAIQNPEPTVTVGVISALHRGLGRVLSRDRDYNDLIQTDAAINPGNSGGPLVNLKGEVVGINVAIFSTTGGYQGLGFAIPVNAAKRIISRLIEGKKISYGWLGVTVQDLNEDLVKYFNLPDKNGVLVAKVLEESPAQRCGIKESDVIRDFDGKPVTSTRELIALVSKTEVGRKVKMTIIRDKKPVPVEVIVGERPQELEEAEEEGAVKPSGAWRGLKVEEITPEISRRFNLDEKKGVVVVDIEPGTPADESDLIVADVISNIKGNPVKGMADYNKAVKETKGDALIGTGRGYFILKEKVSE